MGLVDESAETSDCSRSTASSRIELKNLLHIVDGELVLLKTLISKTTTHDGLHVLGVSLNGLVAIFEHGVPVLVLRVASGTVAVENRALLGVAGELEGLGVASSSLLVAAIAEVVVTLSLGELGAGEGLAVSTDKATLLLEGFVDLVELVAKVGVAGISTDTLLKNSLGVGSTREGEEGNSAAEVALAPLGVQLDALLGVLESVAVHVLTHVSSGTIGEIHVIASINLDGLTVEVDCFVELLLTESTVTLLLESLSTLTSAHLNCSLLLCVCLNKNNTKYSQK